MNAISVKQTEQVDLGVSDKFLYGTHPRVAVNKAIKDRFTGDSAPSYLKGVTFKGGKFLVEIPANLDDDDYANHLASFEGIVYAELNDILNDGGVQEYMTEAQLDRLS